MWDRFSAEVAGIAPPGFYLLNAVMVAAALFLFFLIWRNLHRARLIEDTPTARIRSAPQGYVELEGTGRALDGPPIVAPLTGTPCLWYRYRIERRETHRDVRGHTRTTWRRIHHGVSEALFALEDGTGRCVVDPAGAEVAPSVRRVWHGASEWPAAGPAAAGWRRWVGGDYRYTEERLMVGPVYALGLFRTLGSAETPLHEEVGALLRAWKADRAGLTERFDADGDGEVDMDEWETARAAARRQVLRERATRAGDPPVNTLARPVDGRPYLLSARPQHGLARRYRRRAAGALAGFVVAACAFAAVIIARIG